MAIFFCDTDDFSGSLALPILSTRAFAPGPARLTRKRRHADVQPKSPHVDRFHIVANMNKALDNVRAEETSRMKREGRALVLKKSRWLLLKRRENLGGHEEGAAIGEHGEDERDHHSIARERAGPR